ncbi:hypothetical protein [uncultured Megasphaera sp.]|uniref:hypothetical protein n=1 Tax=uncultured Megasphaera sp. TaxID=165188 RepID=UPI00266CDBC2|nr:hypothetical protein [uncultured Megasphaera sp.]
MAQVGYFEYVAKNGDTWDSIAFMAYKVERMSHYLIQANLQYIDVLTFEGGERLKIPIVDTLETPKTLPPWRR